MLQIYRLYQIRRAIINYPIKKRISKPQKNQPQPTVEALFILPGCRLTAKKYSFIKIDCLLNSDNNNYKTTQCNDVPILNYRCDTGQKISARHPKT